MSSLFVEQRAAGVLESLGIEAVTMAASGRYRRSAEIQPGVRYWSSSSDRAGTDSLGVQFFGPGLPMCNRLRNQFLQAGFEERNPQTAQVTFCKSVGRLDGGRFDVTGLTAIRDEIDGLIGEKPTASKGNVVNFAAFMRASPLAGVDLALDSRAADERPDVL
jgi:hypothetical protein